MRKSASLACLLLVGMLVPLGSQASHCNEITVYSTVDLAITSVSWDPVSFVGCAGGQDQDTDLIVPNSISTRTFISTTEAPTDGFYDVHGQLQGSYANVAGTISLLSFTRGTNAQGAPANFWYSQEVPHTAAQSVDPAFSVVAHVCIDEYCPERTYSSVTNPNRL